MYRVYSQTGGYKDFKLMSDANEWITEQQVELVDHGYQVFTLVNGELDITRFGAGSLILLDPSVYDCLVSKCMEGFLLPPIGALVDHARIATLRSVGGVVDFIFSGEVFQGVAVDGGLRITFPIVSIAYRLGFGLALQIKNDPITHQNGAGVMDDNDQIPDEDYQALKRLGADLSSPFVFKSYKTGYNAGSAFSG